MKRTLNALLLILALTLTAAFASADDNAPAAPPAAKKADKEVYRVQFPILGAEPTIEMPIAPLPPTTEANDKKPAPSAPVN